jgi:hypothetical protein
MDYMRTAKKHSPYEHGAAKRAYTIWAENQDDADACNPWEELSDIEQERWRRYVRLCAVLGGGSHDA